MELSGLAVIMDKSAIERLPHQPWEGTSPREDVESMFFRALYVLCFRQGFPSEAYKEFSEQVEISLNDGLATRHPDWPR